LRWAVSSEVAARVMDGMARARARERAFVIWLGGVLVLFWFVDCLSGLGGWVEQSKGGGGVHYYLYSHC
jgi:hypothetical protein